MTHRGWSTGAARRVVGDDRVSSFYGQATTIGETIGVLPKSPRDLVRERIRQERDQRRKLSALAANPDFRGEDGLRAYLQLMVDWNDAMREEVKLTDDQAICLGAYLGLAKDGSLEIDPSSGWPVHWSYCAVGEMLHALDATRFRNRSGGPVRQQTVKDKVVPAFSKKLFAHLERVQPATWTLEMVRKVVEEGLGDASHCVPHQQK